LAKNRDLFNCCHVKQVDIELILREMAEQGAILLRRAICSSFFVAHKPLLNKHNKLK